MLQSCIFCLISCMSTFCINNCLTHPWFSPSQHVFPTSPTLGQVASPFVRSLCSQEVNIIEDIFYPRHLHIPNLLEFPIDITFKFYGLALMRSKLNLSCICGATSTRSTSTLLESSISWWRPPSKISIQQWKCPFATQELWEQLKSPSFEVRTILKGTQEPKKAQNSKLCEGATGGAMSKKVENWNKMHSKNQKNKIGKLQENTHLRILRIDKKKSWRMQTIRNIYI